MGTTISIHLLTRDADATRLGEDAVARCFAELRDIDRVFSTYRDDSDISRLRRGEAALDGARPARRGGRGRVRASGSAPPGVASRRTGAAGSTRPATSRAGRSRPRPGATWLRSSSSPDVVAAGINAGGDLQLFTADAADWRWQRRHRRSRSTRARSSPRSTWRTARSRHPEPRSEATTSSIRAPGSPARDVVSATVVADGLAAADVWATTAVVAGHRRPVVDRGRLDTRTGVVIGANGAVRRWLGATEVSTHTASADGSSRSTLTAARRGTSCPPATSTRSTPSPRSGSTTSRTSARPRPNPRRLPVSPARAKRSKMRSASSGRIPGPWSLTRELRPIRPTDRADDVDRGAGGRVLHRVVEQGDAQSRQGDRGMAAAGRPSTPDIDRDAALCRPWARSDCAAASTQAPTSVGRSGLQRLGLGRQQHVGEHVVHHRGIAAKIDDGLVDRLAALVPALQDLDAAAERRQRGAQLVAGVRDEVALHPQRLGQRPHRAARGEPCDEAEQHHAEDPEDDDPRHDAVDVDDDVVGIARDRGRRRPGPRSSRDVARMTAMRITDAGGDDQGRGHAHPQPDAHRRLPHAALVVGGAHVGAPTR